MIAITRGISPAIVNCELTHLARAPIDLRQAEREHEEYERALTGLGCHIRRLECGDDMPDSVFIEDTAVVLDEVAIISRPGAESRRRETVAVAAAVAAYRPVVHITAPGTLDGGDVLVAGRRVFVGISTRTNRAGFEQMERTVSPHGYVAIAVPVERCLHLKSAVSTIGDAQLLINRQWIDASAFRDFDLIDVDASEPFGASALRVGTTVVYPEAYARTAGHLQARGITVTRVPAGELAKAEGGVTCCCLLVP